MSKASKNISPLATHKQELCDCFKENVKNVNKKCVYSVFPDGWSFTPDVGNSSFRGEIFTPLWVCKNLIAKTEMFPDKVLYENNFNRIPVKILEDILSKEFFEPAVGTGNISATVLYYRLQCANQIFLKDKKTKKSEIALSIYHKNMLTAIGSLKANDIDVGNIQTTKQRLLGGTRPLNHSKHVSDWCAYLEDWLASNSHNGKLPKKVIQGIELQVNESLNAAHKHWGKFTKGGSGVIDVAYLEATEHPMPKPLRSQLEKILDKNIKLFNGIVEKDTIDTTKGFYCPGWGTVNWTWWEFKEVTGDEIDYVASQRLISLKKMIKTSELEQLQKKQKSVTGTERKVIDKAIKMLELEIHGIKTPGSLDFG